MKSPMLSICCITYNHAGFIRQTLDGFVMQKTDFDYQIVIHDDASDDGTTEIIKEYAAKYPDLFVPIYQTENQYSKGKAPIIDFMLDKLKGKYVAFCEGDDYWTDRSKLQKQVDFLEAHPDFSICFHPVKVVWEDHSREDSIFPTNEFIFNKHVLELEDLLQRNFIQTNSAVYRWDLKKEEWPEKNFLPRDYMFHLIHAAKGKIGFLDDVMAVYRKHPGGVWNGCGKSDEWFIRCGLLHARFYEIIQNKFGEDQTKKIRSLLNSTCRVLLQHRLFDKLHDLAVEYPDCYFDFSCSKLKKQENISNGIDEFKQQIKELSQQNNEMNIIVSRQKITIARIRKVKRCLIYAAVVLFIVSSVLSLELFLH